MKTNRYFLCVGALVVGCKAEPGSVEAPPPAQAFNQLARDLFNQRALEHATPVFWSQDRDGDNTVDPDELAPVWGLEPQSPLDRYVANGQFTEAFTQVYQCLTNPATPGADDSARQAALHKEVEQGFFTLVEHDFRAPTASDEDRAVVEHVLKASAIIENLYAKQMGTYDLGPQIAGSDPLSKLAFFLNQGPFCSAPATEGDPACHALPLKDRAPRISGLYPASLQSDKTFCEKLHADPEHEKLLSPFTVVQEKEGKLTAVPYHEVYGPEMQAVSLELKAAAVAIQSPGEQAFKTYLHAAAQAFLDNGWPAADEAWAAMNAENSKWYLRIGPDEVYFEPCSQKAGFHVSFALINKGSLEWQRKLDPIKNDMEQALAQHAGAPYKARNVSFHLPDFIDVVVNAGDSRDPRGSTIGQSLPNWGAVANEGRGRTVAMTNFYTDADSKKRLRAQASSLLCSDSMATYSDEQEAQVLGTVLHEAAHNLGPSHEYKVKGKTDDEAFGGPLASMLEELKAQTSALYFTDWLAEKKLIDDSLRQSAHLRDITWGMGHIARGMYDSEGKPKPYSQLSAIQLGFLLREGALLWKADDQAANGTDRGCLSLQPDKLASAIDKLTTEVVGIKARADKAGAEELKATFVDKDDDFKKIRETIRERWQRFPQASFLYSVKL